MNTEQDDLARLARRPAVRFSDLPLPGCVRLALGDVLQFAGEDHIVDFVNGSRARLVPMGAPERKEIADKFSESGVKSVFSMAREVNIAPCVERSLVTERRGEQGLKDFLEARKARRIGAQQLNQKPLAEENENEVMKNKNKVSKKSNSKPRGGLAAEVAARKASERSAKSEPNKARDAADIGAAKPNRKASIRALYLSNPPMKKSEMVAVIRKEFGGEVKAVTGAVNNEASYMKLDGLSPKWAPENDAAKA